MYREARFFYDFPNLTWHPSLIKIELLGQLQILTNSAAFFVFDSLFYCFLISMMDYRIEILGKLGDRERFLHLIKTLNDSLLLYDVGSIMISNEMVLNRN